MADFPSTHWSFVTSIRQADTATRHRLVEAFLIRYMTPLRAHVAGQFSNVPEQDRDDLLQDFITSHIIQKSILDRAEQERGQLRSFLRVSLNNHVKSWMARQRRDVLFQAADLGGHERGHSETDPALGFDLAWARYVLTEAVIRLKDECSRSGRSRLWDVFDLRVLRPVLMGAEPTPYQQLAERFGTPTRQLENLLITAKRQFARNLRDIVGAYTSNAEETEEEIRELWRIASSWRNQGSGVRGQEAGIHELQSARLLTPDS